MPADADVIARLDRVIRTGSSAPVVAESGSGEVFVVKLAGSGAGPHGLLTEYLANGIAGRLGLAVSPARPLFLAERFPWQVGTDEFDDMVQRSAGWNLGIAYVADAFPLQADDLASLPDDFLSCLAASDSLLQNVDRSAANPNLIRSGQNVLAIDHGSCLFMNRIAAGPRRFAFDLPANHFLALTRFADVPRASIDVTAVSAALPVLVDTCPDAWIATLPFDRAELLFRLARYLDAFAHTEPP